MKWSILLVVACFGILGVHNAAANWCMTATDNSCGDETWGTAEYTLPEFTDSITIRYDAGEEHCAINVELWLTDVTPPVLIQEWSEKCGCGVVVCQLNFDSQRNVALKVRGHDCLAMESSAKPCLSAVSANMYWPGTNMNCNYPCIPD